jgi:hypothetical protein
MASTWYHPPIMVSRADMFKRTIRNQERFEQKLTLYLIQVVASVRITCTDDMDLIKEENASDKVQTTTIL